jgi:hypothetical protein
MFLNSLLQGISLDLMPKFSPGLCFFPGRGSAEIRTETPLQLL